MVALFMEPETALTWMNDPSTPPANDSSIPYGYQASMPLFNSNFAVNCQGKCDQMNVWTGFKPRAGSYQSDPGVVTYAADVAQANPAADLNNSFVEGGYVGMGLLINALQQAGPYLTRDSLKSVLDGTCFTPGITIQSQLCWTRDNRFANTTMQQFTIQYKGTFAGWKSGPFEQDPRPTAGIGN